MIELVVIKTKPLLNLPLIGVFLIATFFLTILPLRDFDIWFHVKSGEVISKQGIIHHDVFSHSAYGREWAPYEWLYQITVYYFQQAFGFDSIKYLTAGFITFQIGVLVYLLRSVFKLNLFLTLATAFVYIASVYEFFTSRPHVFAYTFLVFNLSLILTYFTRGKNFLIWTLPITLIWANLHGSIFLDVGFFLSYTILAYFNYYQTKDESWLKKFKTLGIFTILSSILTILPPLGFLQYQLLYKFFILRSFISSYIAEWAPLSFSEFGFIIFSVTTVLILIIFATIVKLKKSYRQVIWIVPLLPFLLLPYLAQRNLYLGYITLALMEGWILTQIFPIKKPLLKYLTLGVLIAILASHIWLYQEKKSSFANMRFYYPTNATQFIKINSLQGNMFNEYGYGGYLLYHLYPQQKVMIDGRTDVYLCCEMPDTMDIVTKKTLPDSEYKLILDKLWEKYQISYVLLRTEKHTVLRKITKVLSDDPTWNLVFWDDHTQLFVKRDGKNDHVLKNFETKAATPYNRDPYKSGLEDQAFTEYERMIKFSNSSKSRNTIGFIYLKKGRYEEARKEFEQAAILDITNESPLMNLAELAASNKQYEEAIFYYQKALTLAPDRGLIYIRLGQLYISGRNDIKSAREIWQKGVKETVDDEAKATLNKLLSSNK